MILSAKKRYRKILLLIVAIPCIVLLSFHFWFVHHAESIIEDMVRTQSKGKVELRVKKFKFNWFSKNIELHQATFFTADTSAAATYLFYVKQLKVNVQSVWPLVFEKMMLINSMELYDPEISVTRKPYNRKTTDTDSSLSLPQEMGRIYNSIQDALRALEVTKFQIINGSFALSDQSKPENIPVKITRIHLQLDNLRIDSTQPQSDQRILFSDNVSLETDHQDILFPDGVHRLSFRDFKINLQNKLVEFDSCTIEARRGDSSTNSFRIFFDKLQMTNIDFDTLYHAERIKADSVYAFNPQINLNVELNENSPVGPPRLDVLVQQLTGDLDIDFVVVENATVDIQSVRKGIPTSFSSTNNNFTLEGLRVQHNMERPVSIDRFEMAIRNYENFIKDSAYSIQFDSIIINDNRISLSNFVYSELEQGRQYNKLGMRQLELYGLSWDDLVFNQRLRADQVTLIKPSIQFDLNTSRHKKNKNVFNLLAGLSKALQLQRLHIVQGEVNIKLPGEGTLELNDATILLQTHHLLQATSARDLRDAIQYLDFESGNFKWQDWQLNLNKGIFVGGQNTASAELVNIQRGNQLKASIWNLKAPFMLFDEYMQLMAIHGLMWSKAQINFLQQDSGKAISVPNLILDNLTGSNTRFTWQDRENKLEGIVSSLQIAKWKSQDGQPYIDGLGFELNAIKAEGYQHLLLIESWKETSNNHSQIKGLQLRQANATDSVRIDIPEISAGILWNDWLRGQRNLKQLILRHPQIKLSQLLQKQNSRDARNFRIDDLLIVQPDINITLIEEEGRGKFAWKASPDDSIQLQNLIVQTGEKAKVSVDNISFRLRGLHHQNKYGKSLHTGEGVLTGEAQDIRAIKNDLGTWDWQGMINRVKANQFKWDNIGKHNGRLELHSANLENLTINKQQLLALPKLIANNPQLNVEQVTGYFENDLHKIEWNNIRYNNQNKILKIDSSRYTPNESREAFYARKLYQTDYMRASTGAIVIGPMQPELFANDTILAAATVHIYDAQLTDFRDKRLPRQPGLVRYLPGALLQKIPFRFAIDSIYLHNTNISYEEMDEKTNKSGSIDVNSMNAVITNARNYHMRPGDSLHISASALLAKEIPTRLSVKESYLDSLNTFKMLAEMDGGDLKLFNQTIGGLASAEIQSGQLDSLRMQVIGNNNAAAGSMQVYYSNLKVKLLNERPKSLGNKLKNFVANTIIRNKNKGKGGTVFVTRLTDRSAINYLVKITLSGVISNIGIKKTQKEAKKYRQKEARKAAGKAK